MVPLPPKIPGLNPLSPFLLVCIGIQIRLRGGEGSERKKRGKRGGGRREGVSEEGGREDEAGNERRGGLREGWFERKWGSKRWGGEMRGAGGRVMIGGVRGSGP